MPGNMIGESLRLWRLALDYLDDRKRSRATVREFDSLGPESCEQVLGDSGLTRREFDNAMRLPFASQDLLASAMRAVGIDAAAVASKQPEAYRDLCRTCMLCEHRLRCRSDLGHTDLGRGFQDYCPNREHFLEFMGCGEARARARRH
jgi:hypothetical protein